MNDNFLKGWCRQLRAAIEDHSELGYEAAELIEECADLLTAGDSGDEVDTPDGGRGEEVPDGTGLDPNGDGQSDQCSLPGLAGDMAHSGVQWRGDNHAPAAPGGAGPALLSRRVLRRGQPT